MMKWIQFGREKGYLINFLSYPHTRIHLQNGIIYVMEKNFELVEKNAVDSPVENIKWYGKESQTDEKPMHDKGKGEPVLIRLFEFKFPPTLEHLPTKEEILTPEYLKQVRINLWADGLRLISDDLIRIDINKEGCKIFAPCQATTGNSFLEEPKTIQEWTK